MKGHFDKAGLPPCRVLREFRVADGAEVKVGDKVSVDLFAAGDTITVTGISRGKGFQGVVKRHHFRGGAATHGSMFHRAPGSIGASAFPSRVLPGMRGAGHMGTDKVTRPQREGRARGRRQQPAGRARRGAGRGRLHRRDQEELAMAEKKAKPAATKAASGAPEERAPSPKVAVVNAANETIREIQLSPDVFAAEAERRTSSTRR